MHIDWASLVQVAVAAAAAALAVVLLVAFALVGLSAGSGVPVDDPSRTRFGVGTIIAALCLFAAGLIVCYGLYLIIA